MKTLIAGIPKAGKTTLANKLSKDVKSTDDIISLGWSEASEEAANWFNKDYSVIEGVAVPRALRKWLATNEGKPCDEVYFLNKEREQLSLGQQRMANGCRTVWNEVLPELRKRGVKIRYE